MSIYYEMAHQVGLVLAQQPPPGGPDFSNIAPDSKGVPKSGVMYTIAQVLLFFGLGICFVVLIGGIVVWVGGHMAGGMHLSQNAKTNMVRAALGGILLTSAGAVWTWIVAVN
ncbi:hypothetical protein [Amycolatopsis tucumanensis]|uniref:Integral membrane protein n=2 Tax=Amycolatopsis TaxID=1813 RepID=A0ABP7HDA4_9PSEU|nr:hypothetical protein [Amycolatopsis tucumanensis]MCF6423674.1 hypothetical protein [Amycolatopsis tucumanensis]